MNNEIQQALYNMFHKHDGEIQLQGIGYRKAKAAEDFKIGDVMICNFGYTQTVVDIQPCGKTMIKLFVKCQNGCVYEKKTRKTTQFAYEV